MQWMATVFAARMRWKRQVLREAPGRQGVHQSIQQIQLPFGNQTWRTWGIFHQAVFDCRRYFIYPRKQYLGLVWSDLLMGTYQLGTRMFVDYWCSNDSTWFDLGPGRVQSINFEAQRHNWMVSGPNLINIMFSPCFCSACGFSWFGLSWTHGISTNYIMDNGI